MSATSFLVILAMAAVTYASRAGGFWLARRMPTSPFLRAWLEHLPGAVFAALVAPMALAAGPAGALGAAASFLAMRASGQFVLAIAVGLGCFLLGRAAGLGERY